MLERVRDFRYQEIKNWKPIVSLRDSYRRESTGKWILVGLAFLVFVGVCLYLGNLQPQSDLANKKSTSESSAVGSIFKTESISNVPVNPAAQLPQKNTAPASSNERLLVSTKSAARQQRSAKNLNPNRVSDSRRSASLGFRVGVVNPLRLFGDNKARFVKQAKLRSDQQLAANIEALKKMEGSTPQMDKLYLNQLEQKHKLAAIEIRQSADLYVDSQLRRAASIIQGVARDHGFDVVIRSDKALAYSNSVDITGIVLKRMNEDRLRNEQFGDSAIDPAVSRPSSIPNTDVQQAGFPSRLRGIY